MPVFIELFLSTVPSCLDLITVQAKRTQMFANVYVVTVSFESEATILGLMQSYPTMRRYNVAVDPCGSVKRYVETRGAKYVPQGFLFDAKGTLMWSGYPDVPELTALLHRMNGLSVLHATLSTSSVLGPMFFSPDHPISRAIRRRSDVYSYDSDRVPASYIGNSGHDSFSGDDLPRHAVASQCHRNVSGMYLLDTSSLLTSGVGIAASSDQGASNHAVHEPLIQDHPQYKHDRVAPIELRALKRK